MEVDFLSFLFSLRLLMVINKTSITTRVFFHGIFRARGKKSRLSDINELLLPENKFIAILLLYWHATVLWKPEITIQYRKDVEQCTWDIIESMNVFFSKIFFLVAFQGSFRFLSLRKFSGEKSFRNKRKRSERERFVTNELPLKITSQYTLIKSESISNGRKIYVLCCFSFLLLAFLQFQWKWEDGIM